MYLRILHKGRGSMQIVYLTSCCDFTRQFKPKRDRPGNAMPSNSAARVHFPPPPPPLPQRRRSFVASPSQSAYDLRRLRRRRHPITRVAFCDGLFAMDGLPQTPSFCSLLLLLALDKHESSYGVGHQPNASRGSERTSPRFSRGQDKFRPRHHSSGAMRK